MSWLLADAVTDLVQGFVIVIGLAALALAVVLRRGGIAATVAAIEPGHLEVLGNRAGLGPLALLEEWAIPVVSSRWCWR